jgi:phosphoribosyl 1,2-cyclic phosphodiesterase
MGKTFRESVLNHFERHTVTSVDSIVITHGHCDAYGGLDDVRDLTDRKPGMMDALAEGVAKCAGCGWFFLFVFGLLVALIV